MVKQAEKVIAISLKLNIVQSEDVTERLKHKELRYRSASDFVTKAVDTEIKISGLKLGLKDEASRIYFDMILAEYTRKAYDQTRHHERTLPIKMDEIKELTK